MKQLSFNFEVPIKERGFLNDDFIIQGTAINATVTGNNHKFLPEELQKSATSLSGVPLLIDHRNEVDAIKGRVISGVFNEIEEKVDFKAKVIDKKVRELIEDGRLNSVSVGAAVENITEEEGFLVPRGIQFKELSLVAVPADEGATFQIALRGALEKSNLNIGKREVEKMKDNKAIVEQDEPEEPKAEPEPEVVPEPEPEPVEPEKEPDEEAKIEAQIKATKLRLKQLELKELKKKAKILESDLDEEPVKAEEPEDEDLEEVEEKYKIVQGFGALRGGSFTLVR